MMPRLASSLRPATVLAALLVPGAGSSQLAAAGPVPLQPHRAIYELTLARAASGSGITEMSGRLVYEFTGAACEGYTQNMRFVTRATSSDGSEQLNDIRTSSFEEASSERLDFSSTHHIDSQVQVTEGRAARSQPISGAAKDLPGRDAFGKDRPSKDGAAKDGPVKDGPVKDGPVKDGPVKDGPVKDQPLGAAAGDRGGIAVDVRRPEAKQLSLPATVYFPIQHSVALLDIARGGGNKFLADLYDGSERGDKVSATTTFIGKPARGEIDALPEAARTKMRDIRFWPISTSYFEKTKSLTDQDAVPSHEMSARFYENGVSTRLALDYGDFALKGELKDLTFLPAPKCAEGR